MYNSKHFVGPDTSSDGILENCMENGEWEGLSGNELNSHYDQRDFRRGATIIEQDSPLKFFHPFAKILSTGN